MLRVAVRPEGLRSHLVDAVVAGGGTVADPSEAEALVWTHTGDAEGLAALLDANPSIRWVQLPWAGIEPYTQAGVVDDRRVWTCGKGVYAEPVAEHVLALTLALLRDLPERARASRWGPQSGTSLVGATVTVLGAGGIAEELARFLAPFRCDLQLLGRRDDHSSRLPVSDVVVLALALTEETAGIVDRAFLERMRDDAVLVNVARGEHVVTSDLADALHAGAIRGAALDVTDPEPLPSDHPLWSEPRCLITPHTANTEAMARPLISARVTENVRRRIAGAPLLGLVDPALGY